MKRALVTGGTRGIGLQTALLLAERGYLVTATYASDEAGASAVRARYPEIAFCRCDVRDERAMGELIARLPSLDVLVCNAGAELFKQVQDVSWEEYSRIMDINMGGVFLACKYGVKKMLGRGGAIVAVSSVWGETGASCESVYSASKGAVIAFTKSLAKELAPAGITVNCVTPGVIETAMNARLSEAERGALREEIPLGRFGEPEEVAQAIVFLAEHVYITGAVLPVNGGFHI